MSPSVLDGLILGLVQGLTEFLPISSSGHLVLAEEMLGWRSEGLYLEIGLHLATLLSVCIAYRTRIGELVAGLWRRDPEAVRYAGLLLLASVPAGIAGIGFRDFFEDSFQSGIGLGLQFLATAGLLWMTRGLAPRAGQPVLGVRAALWMGVAQAVAILPAISRSGATIVAGMLAGVPALAAAEFSFLMSIIAVAGSGLLEIRHIPPDADLLSGGFIMAFAAALLSGVWAIRFLVDLLRSQRFYRFAWYCAAVGLVTIAWYAVVRP